MQGGSSSVSEAIQTSWSLAKARKDETDGWAEAKKKGGDTLYSKKYDDCPINCFKVVGVVEGVKPQQLVDMMWAWREEKWKLIDPQIDTWQIIDEIDDNNRVIHQTSKLTWPIHNRDMVMASGRIHESDGTHALVFRSVTHDKAGEKEGVVRATVLMSGWVFSPEGDGTKVNRIVHVNPEGHIPAAVVNHFSKSILKAIACIREAAASQ